MNCLSCLFFIVFYVAAFLLAGDVYSQTNNPIYQRVPAAPFAGCQYKTTVTDTVDQNGTTFTGVDIGAEHPDRVILLAILSGVNANVTATINGYGTNRVQTQNEFSVVTAKIPVGTTASITVTATGSIRKAVGVFVAYPTNPIVIDAGGQSANATTDANVADQKVQASGCLVYSGGQLATLGDFTTTWNGTDAVTEDVDAQLEAASSYTFGHINITNSTDLSDLNMAESVSGTKRLAVVTIRPPRNQ